MDTTAPTVVFTDNIANSANRSTTAVVYTLTFSEPVIGLDVADFSVTNGTLGALTAVAGNSLQWTLSVTPTLGVSSGFIGVTLKAGAVTDLSGNPNLQASNASQAIDTSAPMAPKPVTTSSFHYQVNPQVTIQTSLGSIVVELYPEKAPATVANMLGYASVGFYDNTIFHRVIPGFMVQGGGFGSGLVNWGTIWSPIPLESNNGLSNMRGTLAMARTNVADSATTQFFINQVDNLFLNYKDASAPGYAVFGQVLTGMAVVDSIASVPTTTVGAYADVPVSDVTIQSVRQTVAGSAISNTGSFSISGTETAGQWIYSLNAGANWYYGTGSNLVVPDGNYAASSIRVAQVDAAGNFSSFYEPFTSALTVDTVAPTVSSYNPADEAVGVAPNSNLVLSFSETIVRGSGTIVLQDLAGHVVETFDAATSTRLSFLANSLTIDPNAVLVSGQGYQLVLAAGGVKDVAGNAFSGGSSYNFTVMVNHPVTGSVTFTGSVQAGQQLHAVATLSDADGLGTLHYQWNANGSAIAGANSDTLLLNSELATQRLTVTVSYVDGAGFAETLTGGLPRAVDVQAYAWNTHVLLSGVSLDSTSHQVMTDSLGSAHLQDVTAPVFDPSATRAVPAAEAAATSSAVNLQDAIAILKLVVGLPVNSGGHALSPYQALAADYDGNGTVNLSDAIGVLKHVVGLSAPDPTWHFANELDASVPTRNNTSPGTAPSINADLSTAASPVHVGLVGWLSGDVDGSYAGAPGAADLDVTQPGYLSELVLGHPGLTLDQFGVYS